MIFAAEERRIDGLYGQSIDATDWQEAERICASLGWKLLGELGAIVDRRGAMTWCRETADNAVAAMLARASRPTTGDGAL